MSAFGPVPRIDGLHAMLSPEWAADGLPKYSATGRILYVIDQGQFERLHRMVFAQDPSCPVFAVLDGAIIDDLPALLQRHAPDAMCLFSGDLDPMLAAAAPYLFGLTPGSPAAALALRDGWNAHWGIVLVADPGTSLHDLRAHLRRILRVRSPDGEPMLFRFYDPRAFRCVVPTFDVAQRQAFFGPIRISFVESPTGDVLQFLRDGDPTPRALSLSEVA
jgi:hypothetical protein